MQASVPRNHIEKFKGRVVEGHAYYVHYLEVKQARDTFRFSDHFFEAWLTKWTEVTEISTVPESLPRYAYKLRSFQSLLASTGDKTYLAGNFLCACCFLVLSGFFHFCSCSMVCLLMQRCLCDCRCGRHCYWCICSCYN
jgi:hypothetical protein